MQKGQEFEVVIDRVKFPNLGILNIDGVEVRVKNVIKGQRLLIRISRKRKNYMQAKVVEVLEKSYLEAGEACGHFGICGGCMYQNLKYEDELAYKKELVENLFEDTDLGLTIDRIVPSPKHRDYRNKMEYSFGDEYKDGPLSLGMHRKNRFYEIETVWDCNIADRDFATILTNSLEFMQARKLSFYNRRNHKGFLRNLVVRKSLSRGEILVNLVTSSQDKLDLDEFLTMLRGLELEGQIVGVLYTINDNVADIIKVDEMEVLYGRDYIVEEICGLKFKVSPFSFFQTNTFSAEELYNIARDKIGDLDNKLVFDLYSGTGTIAQIMSQSAREVVAIEIVPEAVEMARKNAELNGIDNIDFIEGDMFKVIDEIDKKPDLIVVDPPRIGLNNAIDKIIDFGPREFLYISCNPVSLVKDLESFKEAGYKIGPVTLVDQFPRTGHIEALTLLTRDI